MRHFHNVRGRIAGLAFSADGKTLMACVRGGMKVAVWNLETGTFRHWNAYADAPVCSLAFSPDGKWLAVGDDRGMVFPHEYPSLERAPEFTPGGLRDQYPVSGIAFGWTADRSDCHIAMAAVNLCVATMKGTKEGEIVPVPGSSVAVAFSPDGRLLAVVDESHFAIRLWNVWTETLAGDVEFKQEPRSVCFTADSRTVAVAVATRVELRAMEELRKRHSCAHGARVTQVAAHPTQNVVASAGTDGTVRFWNAGHGKEEKAYNWNIGRVTAVAFAPDGLTCAAGGEKGQVVIWDVDA